MRNETEIVPYDVIDPTALDTLIFVPHPDDETFGMGGTILRLTEAGADVRLILMTDGSKGGDPEVRREELRRAAKQLGVKEWIVLDIPDREVTPETRYVDRIVGYLLRYAPRQVFFPSPFEYHRDHRGTAWLVWSALRRIHYDGALYAYEITAPCPFNTLIDISGQMKRKEEIMRGYRSQIARQDYAGIARAFNRLRAFTVEHRGVRYAEAFFRFERVEEDLLIPFHRHTLPFVEGAGPLRHPLVSVLIRTRNRPASLQKTLESVARQTYPYLEVSIVNDGGEEIRPLAERFGFERLNLHRHPRPRGRAASANTLLETARGNYLIFLDDDDTFDPDHIEALVAALERTPAVEAAYSGVRCTDGTRYNRPYDAALLRLGNYLPIHAVLFSRTLVEAGCRFDESFPLFEDWDFWLQVAERTDFYHLDRISATYTMGGASGVEHGERAFSSLDLERWKLAIYDKWKDRWSAKALEETFQALQDAARRESRGTATDARHDETEPIRAQLDACTAQTEALRGQIEAFDRQIDYLLAERIATIPHALPPDDPLKIESTRKHEQELLRLFTQVFGETVTPEMWRWKYGEGGMYWRGVCALQGEKVVGHFNAMFRRVLDRGTPCLAAAVCDVMVDANYRGHLGKRSVFRHLFHHWVDLNFGERRIFRHGFGFPNRRHMRLAEHYGYYAEVDTVRALLWRRPEHCPLPDYLTLETFPPVAENAPVIDALWKQMAADFPESILGVRDRNYLARRYLEHPSRQYRFTLLKKREDGTPVAYCVFQTIGNILLLMDLVAPKKHFPLAVAAALEETRRSDCRLLKVWVTASHEALFHHHDPEEEAVDISIPTINSPRHIPVEEIRNRWFLLYGDTDFY